MPGEPRRVSLRSVQPGKLLNPHWPSGFEGCKLVFCPKFDSLSRFARSGARAFHLHGQIKSLTQCLFSSGVRPQAAPDSVGPVNCYQSFHGVLCSQRWVVAVGGLVSAAVPRKIPSCLFHDSCMPSTEYTSRWIKRTLRGVETLARKIVKPLVLAW